MPLVVKSDPVYVRRRRVVGAVLLAAVVLLAVLVSTLLGDGAAAQQERSAPRPASNPSASPSTAGAEGTTGRTGRTGPSAQTELVRTRRLTGELTPKSVVASPTGTVFAQNMMYTHTVSVFDAAGTRLTDIDDGVELAEFGVAGHPGTAKGAPVEMAFSPDGRTAWVSQYAMYGKGFTPEGADACTSGKDISDSYVYEVDTTTYAVKDVVKVGATPKYVAVTPDGKRVLVTNWCSMDLSVIDAASSEVVATIPTTGKHPRGIAVSPDSSTAYVAVMGSDKVVAVDLASEKVRLLSRTGDGPRHVVVSPDGATLYVTNNNSGTVSAVDSKTGKIRKSVRVGSQPRSMAMSSDGGALYVVIYDGASVTKLRTRDLEKVQKVRTDANPIGITYEPTRKAVWVACYGGSILVFDDAHLPENVA